MTKEKELNIKLTEKLYTAIKQKAKEEERSCGAIVRLAVKKYLGIKDE